jgi:hypothetical protein
VIYSDPEFVTRQYRDASNLHGKGGIHMTRDARLFIAPK